MPPAELAGRPAWPGRTGHRQAAGLRAGTRGAPGVCGAALPACLGHGRGRPDSGCGPPPCCSAGRGDPGRRARARPQSSGRAGGAGRSAGVPPATACADGAGETPALRPVPPARAHQVRGVTDTRGCHCLCRRGRRDARAPTGAARTSSPGASRHRYQWVPVLAQTRQARRPRSDRQDATPRPSYHCRRRPGPRPMASGSATGTPYRHAPLSLLVPLGLVSHFSVILTLFAAQCILNRPGAP